MAYLNAEDQRAYARKHYNENKDVYKKRAARHKAAAISRNTQFTWEYRKRNPCVDCGESDPVVLQFDHQGTGKELGVGQAAQNGWSLERLKKEIEKCVVRCANCHIKRTAEQLGWYKSIER